MGSNHNHAGLSHQGFSLQNRIHRLGSQTALPAGSQPAPSPLRVTPGLANIVPGQSPAPAMRPHLSPPLRPVHSDDTCSRLLHSGISTEKGVICCLPGGRQGWGTWEGRRTKIGRVSGPWPGPHLFQHTAFQDRSVEATPVLRLLSNQGGE